MTPTEAELTRLAGIAYAQGRQNLSQAEIDSYLTQWRGPQPAALVPDPVAPEPDAFVPRTGPPTDSEIQRLQQFQYVQGIQTLSQSQIDGLLLEWRAANLLGSEPEPIIPETTVPDPDPVTPWAITPFGQSSSNFGLGTSWGTLQQQPAGTPRSNIFTQQAAPAGAFSPTATPLQTDTRAQLTKQLTRKSKLGERTAYNYLPGGSFAQAVQSAYLR